MQTQHNHIGSVQYQLASVTQLNWREVCIYIDLGGISLVLFLQNWPLNGFTIPTVTADNRRSGRQWANGILVTAVMFWCSITPPLFYVLFFHETCICINVTLYYLCNDMFTPKHDQVRTDL